MKYTGPKYISKRGKKEVQILCEAELHVWVCVLYEKKPRIETGYLHAIIR